MTKTYIEVVNDVLLDTNETPLVEALFYQTRGFHSFVKSAVNRALMDIINESDEWPWMANKPMDLSLSMHTNRMLTKRREAVIEFPEDVEGVDWDTIVLEDLQEKKSYPLTTISVDEWHRISSDEAYLNRRKSDLGRPTHVFRTADHSGMGFTIIPDKAYAVYYTSWKAPQFLARHDDTLPFPAKYYNVLVSKARYYAWLFRENKDLAGFADKDYNQGLDRMKRALIRPNFTRMRAV